MSSDSGVARADLEALVTAAVKGSLGGSRQVVAAVASAVLRTGCQLLRECDVESLTSTDELASTIGNLVEDRLGCIRPVLRAQVKHGLETGVSRHSSKGLVSEEEQFMSNAARHLDFSSKEPLSLRPMKKLKKLQRGGSGTCTPTTKLQPEPEQSPAQPVVLEGHGEDGGQKAAPNIPDWFSIGDDAVSAECQTDCALLSTCCDSRSVGVVTARPKRRSFGVQCGSDLSSTLVAAPVIWTSENALMERPRHSDILFDDLACDDVERGVDSAGSPASSVCGVSGDSSAKNIPGRARWADTSDGSVSSALGEVDGDFLGAAGIARPFRKGDAVCNADCQALDGTGYVLGDACESEPSSPYAGLVVVYCWVGEQGRSGKRRNATLVFVQPSSLDLVTDAPAPPGDFVKYAATWDDT